MPLSLVFWIFTMKPQATAEGKSRKEIIGLPAMKAKIKLHAEQRPDRGRDQGQGEYRRYVLRKDAVLVERQFLGCLSNSLEMWVA
ncbi:MAG: hypothetical protein M5R42_04305 [Rhodocyclaceae bacterium]|nr:hypothetical protein [Rhodocyclaceae bacterium]